MRAEGVSAAEVIMTQLHAGGKFEQNAYKVSGGLHGVGVSVVNALSEWLDLRIWRNGKEHYMRFRHGEPEAPLVVVGEADGKRGTEVTFLPEPQTFTKIEFDLRDARASPARAGVPELRRDDHVSPICAASRKRKQTLHYEGGLEAFVRYLDRAKTLADPLARS